MYFLRRGLGMAPSPSVSVALQSASAQTGVPLSLLQALAAKESSNNPAAVSPAGAQGLLQLMPATGASLGVTDPFDVNQNALAGAQYLQSLYNQYGDWQTALIAYNEGPGNLATQGAFPSSQAYATSILSAAGVSDSSPSGLPDTGTLDLSSVIDLSGGTTNWALWGLAIGAGVLLLWAAS